MSERNEFGQPVGPVVPGWSGAARPAEVLLEGRTVRLESLAVTHAAELHTSFVTAPPGHWTYMPWGPFSTVEDYTEWVDGAVGASNVEFLTITPLGGRPSGVAGYLAIEPQMGSVEVGGITFSPALQGSVQATEAMFLMMAHAFDDLGYRRYEWKCDALNAPSRSAAERLGFVYEGSFAQHRIVRGRNRDTAWFSITDQRWAAVVKPALRAWLEPSNFDADGGQLQRLQDLRPATLNDPS